MEFKWDQNKNLKIIELRSISFDEILLEIVSGNLLAIIFNSSRNHVGQPAMVVKHNNYCYKVPFVVDGETIFLKTIFPDRKLTKYFLHKLK